MPCMQCHAAHEYLNHTQSVAHGMNACADNAIITVWIIIVSDRLKSDQHGSMASGHPDQPWLDIWLPYHHLTEYYNSLQCACVLIQWSVSWDVSSSIISNPLRLQLSLLRAVACGNCTSTAEQNYLAVHV